MTEQEWLVCTDPSPMLEVEEATTSERKLRLFGCACCRRIWDLVSDHRSRKAVDIAESYADGRVKKAELVEAEQAALEAPTPGSPSEVYMAAGAAWTLCAPRRGDSGIKSPGEMAERVANGTAQAAGENSLEPSLKGSNSPTARRRRLKRQAHEKQIQCEVLRDILGNPFRPSRLSSRWVTKTTRSLAQAIYQDRAFDRMPILADALEDAGCDNADILNHCRQPGEHVRGCWLVDLLLGKS